jgi:hypothetical protein
VTLATPFAGSLNAVRVLSNGEDLPFGLFATALRDTGRSLPGLYELVASYHCVDGDRDGISRKIVPADLASVGADPVLAKAAFDVHERLAAAVNTAGTRCCPIHTLVGVQQPTAQSVRFYLGTATLKEQIGDEDHQGDGTVYRYSAGLRDVRAMPLPQRHASLAKSDEALSFVEAVLTDRKLGEVQAPPGFGIRVPDFISPGKPFEVTVVGGTAGGSCRVTDAQTNVQVAATVVKKRQSRLLATLTVPGSGLYRVAVAGGGYSSVEELVLALAE